MAKDAADIPEADRADGCKHPRETYDLIGHAASEKKFLSAMASGRLHHAWLISGPKGSGKATLAYRIIRHLLGGRSLLPDSLDISSSDPAAQRVEAQGHGNLFVARRPYDIKTKRLKTEIPIAKIRAMTSFFESTPAEDGLPRVALVDCMDEMNRQAENGILKTLEEPPENAFLFLLVNSPGQLLPTIRSRCMSLALRPVAETEILPWLTAQTDEPSDIIEAAVKLSRGGPGKAIALVQNADQVLKPLTRLLSSLGRNDTAFDQILASNLALKQNQNARALFWDCLQDILQSQAAFEVTGEWTGAFRPLPVSKSAEAWMHLWHKVRDMQRVESAINMDKKTVMLTAISDIRAA